MARRVPRSVARRQAVGNGAPGDHESRVQRPEPGKRRYRASSQARTGHGAARLRNTLAVPRACCAPEAIEVRNHQREPRVSRSGHAGRSPLGRVDGVFGRRLKSARKSSVPSSTASATSTASRCSRSRAAPLSNCPRDQRPRRALSEDWSGVQLQRTEPQQIHQIAQKIHDCTEVYADGRENEPLAGPSVGGPRRSPSIPPGATDLPRWRPISTSTRMTSMSPPTRCAR